MPRTGVQWKALPMEYGAAGSAHQYFSEWAQAGFFRRIWREGLIACDLVKGLGWERQGVAGLYGESVPVAFCLIENSSRIQPVSATPE
jgi:hypothetical protein